MSFQERCAEIDARYEANPDPGKLEVAGRLIPLAARRIIRNDETAPGLYSFTGVDELTEFAGVLHEIWIPDAITLRQAANIAIPAVHDILVRQDRLPKMKAWVEDCFFEHGLDRDVAVTILKAHQEAAA